MRVIPFIDEYELAAPLYGMSADALRIRDEAQSAPGGRWLVLDGDIAVGAATSFVRPDDRLFLHCVCTSAAAYQPLVESAVAALGRPIHVTVDADASDVIAALVEAGLHDEFHGQEFRIRFGRALARLRRAALPKGYEVEAANVVNRDDLFALDCKLRDLTPGMDGWQGNRTWFDDEMAGAPPFDPTGYLVATSPSGSMAGLVRVWRNPDEPSLGFIGVLPEHRHTSIAAELLRRSLTAASQWGSRTFRAGTSPSNTVIYPRMERLGAEPLGRTIRFVTQ